MGGMETTPASYLKATRQRIRALDRRTDLIVVADQVTQMMDGPARVLFTDAQHAELRSLRANAQRKAEKIWGATR